MYIVDSSLEASIQPQDKCGNTIAKLDDFCQYIHIDLLVFGKLLLSPDSLEIWPAHQLESRGLVCS